MNACVCFIGLFVLVYFFFDGNGYVFAGNGFCLVCVTESPCFHYLLLLLYYLLKYPKNSHPSYSITHESGCDILLNRLSGFSIIVVIAVDVVEDTAGAKDVDMIIEQKCLIILGVDI
jgi:hypothetical protein